MPAETRPVTRSKEAEGQNLCQPQCALFDAAHDGVETVAAFPRGLWVL